MKISPKTIAAIPLIILVLSNTSYSQQAYASNLAQKVYPVNAVAVDENKSDHPGEAALTEDIALTHPRLANKFSILFPTATRQQWAINGPNLWVSYLNEDRKTSASCTPKGKMNYVIIDCSLEQLPVSFQNTIDKEYPSCKMYNAIEIKAYETMAWQAVL